MKKEQIFRFGKMLHRAALGIGALSILLPVLFWKYIPDKIPMHSGADGVTDRMGDKSELILLFSVILFLMGMMSIVVYYVKSNAASKYAKEAEVDDMLMAYPMVVIMNLVLMCMFAYMVFCSVTVRNLGTWFLPVFLILTFAPLVYYLVKSAARRKERHKELGDYQYQEKTAEGIRYRTKIDWWLGLILLGALGTEVYVLVECSLEKGSIDWLNLGILVTVALVVVPCFWISYTLYPEYLLVSCSIFGKERIPYRAITNMKETHNPLSSAALSLDRLQIDYVVNGRHDMVLISPVRKKEFIRKIEEYRERWE